MGFFDSLFGTRESYQVKDALKALHTGDEAARLKAVAAVGKMEASWAFGPLLLAVEDASLAVRAAAWACLAKLGVDEEEVRRVAVIRLEKGKAESKAAAPGVTGVSAQSPGPPAPTRLGVMFIFSEERKALAAALTGHQASTVRVLPNGWASVEIKTDADHQSAIAYARHMQESGASACLSPKGIDISLERELEGLFKATGGH